MAKRTNNDLQNIYKTKDWVQQKLKIQTFIVWLHSDWLSTIKRDHVSNLSDNSKMGNGIYLKIAG
jgi:hypothetical protein